MRVVVDANVLVSGIFWTGSPHRVLTLWAADRADVLLSPEVMDEYTRVLQEVAAELGRPTSPSVGCFSLRGMVSL